MTIEPDRVWTRYQTIRTVGEDSKIKVKQKQKMEAYGGRNGSFETREYVVKPPDNQPIRIKESHDARIQRWRSFPRINRKRAIALAELWERIGRVQILSEENAVPATIAADSKPAVAAYLFAVHDLETFEISEIMDISPGTVRKYIEGVCGESR